MRAARVAAICLAALVLSGCAALTGDSAPGLQAVAAGDVAARAGDAVVTVASLEDEVQQALDSGVLESPQFAEQFAGSDLEKTVQLQTTTLDFLLKVEILATRAADQFDVEVSADEVDELVEEAAAEVGGQAALEEQLTSGGQTLERFRSEQELNRLIAEVVDALREQDPLTDEDVRAAYQQQQAQFEQVDASHILVETEAEAQQVLQRLSEGEEFAALAQELSLDTGSAQNGGSLGLTPRGTFVPEFEEAIWAGPAPVGQLLGPVETQFGWHVIRVDEFQVTPEDEAVEQVRQQLEDSRGQELFQIWFQQQLSDADPEVAGRFGRWSRTSQSVLGNGQSDDPADQQQAPAQQQQSGQP